MMEHLNTARGANEWADTYGNLGQAAPLRLTQLPLKLLDPWEDASGRTQPFKPYSPEKLQALADNIRKNGVIEAICVRPTPDGRFQIIAGHNRVAAAKLAGKTTIPSIVRQMDNNEAALLLVDSNLQHREKLLPSEKAWAYRVRLEAMNRQGKRTDLTSSPLDKKLDGITSSPLDKKLAGITSAQEIGQNSGDSQPQIYRYIRLTYLLPPLLGLADAGSLSVRAGVELSYLSEAEQETLRQVMADIGCKAPSMAQAAKLRKAAQAGTLDTETIRAILGKPIKAATLSLPAGRIAAFFPPNTSAEQMEAEIYEALLAYRNNNQSPASA